MVKWHSTPTILLPGFAPRIRGMFVDACFSPGFPVCNGKKTASSNSVFRCSGVPVFRCSGVPVFRAVPVFRCSGLFRCSGVPVFRCSGVPGFSTCRPNATDNNRLCYKSQGVRWSKNYKVDHAKRKKYFE